MPAPTRSASRIRVALLLRPLEAFHPEALRHALEHHPARREHPSPRQVARRHGARAEDLEKVAAFAKAHGLRVADADAAKRRVILSGTTGAVAEAFGLRFRERLHRGEVHRVPSRDPRLPKELEGIVVGVLGLDSRPHLRPHLHGHRRPKAIGGHTAPELAARYRFPAGAGRGLRVGLIELGGGFHRADLNNYFASLGMGVPRIHWIGVEGARNRPKSGPLAARLEVGLDLEVLGALLPEAELVVYFAPNTDLGFYEALHAALKDPDGPPSVLSISWGHPEPGWSPLARLSFDEALAEAASLGVTVVASAGDHGSREGTRRPCVNYPASSPWVLGCGGTTLAGAEEVLWSHPPRGGATGGGISECFSRPAWQRGVARVRSALDGRAGRGVPDVAAAADPRTGYRVFLHGEWMVLGGTSASAPLWAALLARCGALLGRAPGFLNAFLYRDPRARRSFRPVTSGQLTDYPSGAPWCACAGLGTPDGTALARALQKPPQR